MKKRIQRLISDERGSVLPIVAASMVSLMGLTALAVDVGRLYVARERLSTVADVAALAAAKEMLTDPGQANITAKRYLDKNGLSTAPYEIILDSANRKVTVKVSNTIPMTFAKVIGHDYGTTGAVSVATVAAISGKRGAVPLGVAQANWKVGDAVVLKMSPNDGTVSPGNYQALALGKSGASMYEQNLMNGYDAWLRAGQWIQTETGNMATPTIRAIKYRMSLDPGATYSTVTKGSPRLVAIPILKDFTVNGTGEVQIVGFGMFFLENVLETGADSGEITGRFLRIVGDGETNGSAPNFGLVATKLIQ